jgi:catechol 2,3-dioxygenase-like lactoylglutathione lyase family enzyme
VGRVPAADGFFFCGFYFDFFGRNKTPMNILKPHVSLNVANIDAAVAFYEKAFGVSVTKRRPGYAKFDLEMPSLNLSMVEAPRTGINASHFGIQVASTDDVIEAKGRFEAAGLRTVSEEGTSCCYAVQDKVWVEDPDGNSWEVFVVKNDTNEMGTGLPPMNAATSSKEGSCCTPEAQAQAKAKAKSNDSCCG